ncbi:hypothetical protein SLOPH_2357 [Spraguea lophii 42_110]|uniref:NTF2 domain-containing protein n=1 Tax=Spraguea lophii (strain 42_110) TaxID=1358809 RepID=S7WDK7_SPRLO|nr:hypothetical protein SLOPH_2357 [Spraguea lophii 42_110]
MFFKKYFFNPMNSRKEIITFLNSYYGALCTSFATVLPFYSRTKLSIAVENGIPDIVTEDYDQKLKLVHKKTLLKVFVSSFDIQECNENILLTVIGQFIYEDKSVKRFSHVFVLENKSFIIKNEICRILDEEILYEKVEEIKHLKNWNEGRLKINRYVKSNRKTIVLLNAKNFDSQKIIDDFMKFGEIVAIEPDNENVLIEFTMIESIDEIIKNNEQLRKKGYTIDMKRKAHGKESKKNLRD